MLSVAAISSGSSSTPDSVALAPVTDCRKTGMKTITAKNDSVVRNSVAETMSKTGSRNSRSGSTGSVARRSCATNATEQDREAGVEDVGALGGGEQQARQRAREQRGAEVVELDRLALDRQVQRGRDQRQRRGADRQVHVEDPAPARRGRRTRRRAAGRRRSRARRPSGCSPGSGRARAARRSRRRSPSPASSGRRRRGPGGRGSATSWPSEPAAPESAEPARKTTIAARNSGLRP